MLPTDHLLLIGTTGMLHQASLALSSRAHHTTALARTTQSLERLADKTPGHIALTTYAVDWTDPDAMRAALIEAMTAHGAFTQMLLWVHRDGLTTKKILADILATTSTPCAIFDVLGSAHADPRAQPSHPGAGLRALNDERVRYHAVILGAKRTEDGSRRWLTHDEICRGTLEAVTSGAAETIVGTLDF